MNVLTIRDMPEDFMKSVITLAVDLKKEGDRSRDDLRGKVLISLYEKASTRTRLSFETAIANLGGQSIVMDFKSSQLSRGETMADTARVLSRYGHAISARLNKHSDIEELAKHATVPVINALTEKEHPCQALADMQTIVEHGKENGKLVFIGDTANNVATSLMYVASRYGMHVVLCGPKGYLPKGETLEAAWKNKAKIEITSDPKQAIADADVIYTDVWVSMGDEAEQSARIEALGPYQVNDELLEMAKPDCIVMHCLPAHRGQEITDSVLDGANATAVWDQAENRMWAQEALLLKLIRVAEKEKHSATAEKSIWGIGLDIGEGAEAEAAEESAAKPKVPQPEPEQQTRQKPVKKAKKSKEKKEETAEEKTKEAESKKGEKGDVMKDFLGF